MTIAGGISAALLHRERTGEAQVVDVSLLSTAMWAMGGTIAVSQDIGMAWQAPPSGEPAAPFNPLIGYFGTADGRFIMFSMLQGFHYWPEVCERLGRTDLVDDPRFDTDEHLMENAAAGAEIVRAEIEQYTLDEIKARLTGMRGQWAIVQDTIEIADDPQVVANGYLQELECGRLQVQAGGDAGAVRRGGVGAGQVARVQRARRRDPHRAARTRLGHRDRPQGEGRRRLTLRTSRWTVRGPWGGCR